MLNNSLRLMAVWFFFGCSVALAADEFTPPPVEERPEYRDLTLKDLDGNTVALNQFKGKVVLLNFWATWCGPCLQELPELEALHQDLQADGLEIVAVNLADDKDEVRKVIDKLAVNFQILHDGDHVAAQTYELVAVPSTFVIDRESRIAFVHYSYRPGDEDFYRAVVTALLKEPAAS